MREEPLRDWHPGEVLALTLVGYWLVICVAVLATVWLLYVLGVVG